MQDFRKSVLQSSLWLKDISQDTFSWSAGKHRLFHACRRAYLIRYYIAQGGWDAGASQIARKAFTEKYLRTFPAWLAEMLADSLAETLLQLKNVPKHKRRGELIHALKLHLSHRIFLADIFLESREYLNDPKKLALFDLYYRTGRFSSIKEIPEECKRFYKEFFTFFPDSAMLERILETDVLSWRVPPDFILMHCGSLPVYLRPRIYAFDRGGILSLEFNLYPQEKDRPKVSYADTHGNLADSLFASYVSGRYNTAVVECRSFMQCAGKVMEDSYAPSPADEEQIHDSAGEMLAVLPSSSSSLKDFPPSREPQRCSRCLFPGTCSYLEC